MPQFLNPVARSIAAATILSAFAFAAPLAAAATESQGAAPVLLAQANPAPSAPATSSSSDARVEKFIQHVHDQLKITAAQQQQWDAVAAVMRDNAQAMRAAGEQRREAKTAVDDLKAYEATTEAHLQGLQKLIPAFETLYNSMSPDQKKVADAVFKRTHHERHHRMGAAHATQSAPPSAAGK